MNLYIMLEWSCVYDNDLVAKEILILIKSINTLILIMIFTSNNNNIENPSYKTIGWKSRFLPDYEHKAPDFYDLPSFPPI